MFDSLANSLAQLVRSSGIRHSGGDARRSAPIIIHFINRLRFRRVKWAAMEFLLASQQRNRRRLLHRTTLAALAADFWLCRGPGDARRAAAGRS